MIGELQRGSRSATEGIEQPQKRLFRMLSDKRMSEMMYLCAVKVDRDWRQGETVMDAVE